MARELPLLLFLTYPTLSLNRTYVIPISQNNCAFGRGHAQFRTVQYLNSSKCCNFLELKGKHGISITGARAAGTLRDFIEVRAFK